MTVWTHCGFSPPSLEGTFEGDLLIVSMNKRNDYTEENLFEPLVNQHVATHYNSTVNKVIS